MNMDAIIKKETLEDEEPVFLDSVEPNSNADVEINQDAAHGTSHDLLEESIKIEIEVESIKNNENNDCCDEPETSKSSDKKETPKKKRRSGRGRKVGANDASNADTLSDAPEGHSRRSRNKSTDKKDDIPIDVFLEKVKEHPILYDPSHPYNYNNRIRDKVWDVLAEELNTSGGQLKAKLRSLRDTYTKYLKVNAIANEQQQNKWQWANHMEFLKPHIDLAKSTTSVDINGRDESNPYKNGNEDTERKSNGSSARNRRSLQNLSIIDKVIDYLNEKSMREYDKLDAIDHFFLSMSKTVKTFPAEQQAVIKNKIFQLVQECELMNLAETKV